MYHRPKDGGQKENRIRIIFPCLNRINNMILGSGSSLDLYTLSYAVKK
jgi:hypothetical protein